jgi:hypothetical protein
VDEDEALCGAAAAAVRFVLGNGVFWESPRGGRQKLRQTEREWREGPGRSPWMQKRIGVFAVQCAGSDVRQEAGATGAVRAWMGG